MPADKKRESESENIDLILLVERALSFFRKYRLIFGIAILLGLAAGFYLYKKIPNTYRSRLLLHSYILTNQEEIQIANTWNKLILKKEYAALARILNCPEVILHQVKRLKAFEIQQVFSQDNPHGFVIEATVTDNAVLPELQKGIQFGFENTPYIRQRLADKKTDLEHLVRQTEAEISKMDSMLRILRGIMEGRIKSGGAVVLDGSSVSRQLVEINEKLVSLKDNLRYNRAVQVLQDFQPFSKPTDPNLMPLLVIGVLFFLVLAYIAALIHSVNSGLKARRLQRNTQ